MSDIVSKLQAKGADMVSAPIAYSSIDDCTEAGTLMLDAAKVIDGLRFAKNGGVDPVAMGILRTAMEKGHKFVLCVETEALSTCMYTQAAEGLDCARMLERFARNERRKVAR